MNYYYFLKGKFKKNKKEPIFTRYNNIWNLLFKVQTRIIKDLNRIMNEGPEIATTQPSSSPDHVVGETCPLIIIPSGPLLQNSGG